MMLVAFVSVYIHTFTLTGGTRSDEQLSPLDLSGDSEFSIRIELRSLRRQSGSIKHHSCVKRAVDRLKTNFAGLFAQRKQTSG